MADFKHIVDLQLRFTDMDAFRHVNNNTIFSIFDDAKYKYLNDMFGDGFFEGRGIVLANLKADFYAPIYYPGDIKIGTRITRVGHKSVTFFQQILDPVTFEVKNECTSIMVYYDVAARHSIEFSPEDKEKILNFEKD